MAPSHIKTELKNKGINVLCRKTTDMIRISTTAFDIEFTDSEQNIILMFLQQNNAKGVRCLPVSVDCNGSEFYL